MRSILLAIIMALTIACSGAPSTPEIRVDESACATCGMLVSDLSFAAAARRADGTEEAFDDAVCLVRFIRSGKVTGEERIWIHSFGGDDWIGSNEAVFIRQARVKGPMGGELVATDRASAAPLATQLGGSVIGSLAQVIVAGAAQ